MRKFLITCFLTITYFSQSWEKFYLIKTDDGDDNDETPSMDYNLISNWSNKNLTRSNDKDFGTDYQDEEQVQPCSSSSENCVIIKYLVKCDLLYVDSPSEDFYTKGKEPCNKEVKGKKGWKQTTCTKLEKGITDLQKSADLWATGIMDDETWKMVKSDKCPNDVFDCACNGIIDKKGKGECKTSLHGERWCYVVANSVCTDKKEERGNWWSYAACEGRNVDEQETSTTHKPKSQVPPVSPPGNSEIIKFLLKCDLLDAAEQGESVYTKEQVPCNKENKSGKGWKTTSCTKLEKGIIDLQKSADLWATGEMDADTIKLIKSKKCPVNHAFVCSCNGEIDDNDEGECKTSLEGGKWCFVPANSACKDKKMERGSWRSIDACAGGN